MRWGARGSNRSVLVPDRSDRRDTGLLYPLGSLFHPYTSGDLLTIMSRRHWLLTLLSAALTLAGKPEVTVTRIENIPNRLFYFDDTPVSAITQPH